MVANRNRVEHAITESLNGAQIGDPMNAMQRELNEMRRQDPRNYADNLRLYERMTRNSPLLPHLDISGMLPQERPHQPHQPHQRPAERHRPTAERPTPELPLPPERPELPSRSTGEERSGYSSNPLGIPGMARPDVADPRIRRDSGHTFAPQITQEGQERVIRQRGTADAGRVGTASLGVTSPFESVRREDREGNLLSGSVRYPGSLNIRLQTTGGEQTLRRVTEATTTFDPRSRSYTTTFNYYNGQARAVTDRHGRTTLTLPPEAN